MCARVCACARTCARTLQRTDHRTNVQPCTARRAPVGHAATSLECLRGGAPASKDVDSAGLGAPIAIRLCLPKHNNNSMHAGGPVGTGSPLSARHTVAWARQSRRRSLPPALRGLQVGLLVQVGSQFPGRRLRYFRVAVGVGRLRPCQRHTPEQPLVSPPPRPDNGPKRHSGTPPHLTAPHSTHTARHSMHRGAARARRGTWPRTFWTARLSEADGFLRAAGPHGRFDVDAPVVVYQR